MARTAARNFLALFFDEVGGWKGGKEQNLSAKIEISVRVRGDVPFGGRGGLGPATEAARDPSDRRGAVRNASGEERCFELFSRNICLWFF
jgi:hypothetical protein